MKLRLQYTTRSLLLTVLVFVLICASVAWLQHVHATRNILTKDHWPLELRQLLSDSRFEHISRNTEVRDVGFFQFCWKMPATDQTVDSHVKRFNLKPVSNQGIEQQRVRYYFPPAWSWPDHGNFRCFACPLGLGAKDGEFEFVLIQDNAAKRMYFYYYFHLWHH